MMPVDLIGWLAAGLTLLSFACRDARRLRLLALGANAAFLTYGASAGLLQVLTLHALLIPANLWRLRQLTAPSARSEPAMAAGTSARAAGSAACAPAAAPDPVADSAAPSSVPAPSRRRHLRRAATAATAAAVVIGSRRAVTCRAARRSVRCAR
ncbi:MAG: hypothetical protein JNJ89_12115 [Rubrivivax sp.]|nr:hypothetical protein [Rubrivivax sp.]